MNKTHIHTQNLCFTNLQLGLLLSSNSNEPIPFEITTISNDKYSEGEKHEDNDSTLRADMLISMDKEKVIRKLEYWTDCELNRGTFGQCWDEESYK